MKKLVTLAAILAASGVAIATTTPATTASQETTQTQMFGAPQDGKHHDGDRKHEKGDRHAKHEKRGGFFDETTAVKSLADTQKAADDAQFSIEGYIVKQTGKKDFIFKDTAGTEMPVEISKKAWHGETVTPNDKVTIRGEVDKEINGVELEVKAIIK